MPVSHHTPAALFVGSDGETTEQQGLLGMLKGVVGEATFAKLQDEAELNETLALLQDRDLTGWDRRANRYDLHPMVRGAVWSSLDDSTATHSLRSLGNTLHSYLPSTWTTSTAGKTSQASKLYNTLIGLGRYEDACIPRAQRSRAN